MKNIIILFACIFTLQNSFGQDLEKLKSDITKRVFDIDNNSILTLQIESMQMKTEIANYDINPYILNANKIVIKFDDEHIITYIKDNVNNQLINNPFLGNNENIIGGFYQNQEDCFYIISDEDYERSN